MFEIFLAEEAISRSNCKWIPQNVKIIHLNFNIAIGLRLNLKEDISKL